MSLRLPPFQPLPPPDPEVPLREVRVADLQPTQMCVGLAEVRSRQQDFSAESRQERRTYLAGKPVPLVIGQEGQMWMVDRHHRLRALVELDPEATAFGYVVLHLSGASRQEVLAHLHTLGWLYLYDGRGQGPHPSTALPRRLLDLIDDPYRSLVWKLKREHRISPQPLIPFHEFRWGAWLRRRPLPPFSSARLEPALPAARALVASSSAAHLAGWMGAVRP
ncbi:MAG: ParB-like protein [Cyanobacteriota bacterium]|nr:ParB-like protein [Cyanobacteriota bacterium]